MGESDSTHILQRGSSFVSKMKELAKQVQWQVFSLPHPLLAYHAHQGGQNVGLETDTLQGVLQQPVRKVKELLTSLAAPAPTALSIPASGVSNLTLYMLLASCMDVSILTRRCSLLVASG